MTFISASVPYWGSPSAVSGAWVSPCFIAHWARIISAGRATCTPFVPRTAMALRCFEPITAPTPERPAARNLSFTMAA